MVNSLHSALRAAPQPNTEANRNLRLGDFFRAHRLESGLTLDEIAEHLQLSSPEVVIAYETGTIGMPVDDIFALTNLLNIPPEDVMEIALELYFVGTD